MTAALNKLQNDLGYMFRDESLLELALTHSSYAHEHGGDCNERLEFLGDALLDLAAAEFLFTAHPDLPEGQLTRMRAALVCESSLCRAEKALGLGPILRMGRGEDKTGGRKRPSILADCMEALFAAVYLDSRDGQNAADTVFAVIIRLVFSEAESVIAENTDYKTLLQETAQKTAGVAVEYKIAGTEGPEHRLEFVAEVYVGGAVAGTGRGRSKKDAETAAAKDALRGLSGSAGNGA
ncbi:MAG: ribonuclease III [Oscillospiraceae bacterium]|jgi:ribonuclease-3|nr:ribonuclease III [Oscillospiraceae bacterium]